MSFHESLAEKLGVSPDKFYGGTFGVLKTSGGQEDPYDTSGLTGSGYRAARDSLAQSIEDKLGITGFKTPNDSTGQLDRVYQMTENQGTGRMDYVKNYDDTTGAPLTYYSISEFRDGLAAIDNKFSRLAGRIQVDPEMLRLSYFKRDNPGTYAGGNRLTNFDQVKYSDDIGAYVDAVDGRTRYEGFDNDFKGQKDGGFFSLVGGLLKDLGPIIAAATLGAGLGVAAAANAAGAATATGAAAGTLDAGVTALGANLGNYAPYAAFTELAPVAGTTSFFGASEAFSLSNAFNTAKTAYSVASTGQSIAKAFGGPVAPKPSVKLPGGTLFGVNSQAYNPPALPSLSGTKNVSGSQGISPQVGANSSGFEKVTSQKSLFLIAAAIIGGVYFLSKKGK